MTRAPLSASWCSSSGVVYIGLTFTATMPALKMPNSTTGDCNEFGTMIATRSPGRRPGNDWRYAANARERRSTSPYVIVVPRFVNAGCAANRSKLASSNPTSDG